MERFLEEMKSYVGLTEADARLIAQAGPALEPHLPALADLFYRKILEHPASAHILSGSEQLARLKGTLQHWARGVLAGRYDAAYANERTEIGRQHVRVGVPQRYVISAMNVVRTFLLDVVDRELAGADAAATKRALNKVLDLDLNLMCESYLEASVRELRELNARLEAANLEMAELGGNILIFFMLEFKPFHFYEAKFFGNFRTDNNPDEMRS